MIQTFIMTLTVAVRARKDILTRILTETDTYLTDYKQVLDVRI